MVQRKILDKKELEYFYNTKGLSQREIANEMKTTRFFVLKNFECYGICVRNQSEAQKLSVIKGLKSSQKGLIFNRDVSGKIAKKQKCISTDNDLSECGYKKKGIQSNGAIVWCLKEVCSFYDKKFYQNHKEKVKESARNYRRTPNGKLNGIKNHNRHKGKGFIPLNTKSKDFSDWHHIHPKLPFVVSIDRNIHMRCLGKKHYDSTNSASGWDIFVDFNSEITSLEYIESKIEIHYPILFKQYWFGDY